MVDHEMQNNVATKGLRAINLSSLLHTQLNTLCSLQVSKSQEGFGGTFAETVEEWRANAEQSVLGLCFTTYNGPGRHRAVETSSSITGLDPALRSLFAWTEDSTHISRTGFRTQST